MYHAGPPSSITREAAVAVAVREGDLKLTQAPQIEEITSAGFFKCCETPVRGGEWPAVQHQAIALAAARRSRANGLLA